MAFFLPLSPTKVVVAFGVSCRDNGPNRGQATIHAWLKKSDRMGVWRVLFGGRMEEANRGGQGETQEAQEEARKIRRLQVMISMVMSVISQDPDMTIEEASELSANARRAALAMFPGKELAFDILYKPRLQRLMKERFRIQ